MVRRAVAYMVQSGPSTQQDRWENQQGYTSFTLAVVISAFLIAAELGDQQGDNEIATYLRETADVWNAAIESWLYVTGTDLARRVGVDGYYVRIVPPALDESSTPSMGRLNLNGHGKDDHNHAPAGTLGTDVERSGIPIDEIVSPDALALVRFGLRSPTDPRILNTIKVIDSLLKVETPAGSSWHRYNGDTYGETSTGEPFEPKVRGVGRAWPLLTGERAHYELAAGRRDRAFVLLHAMEGFAGEGGMIPEQIWDGARSRSRGLFPGRPSGSAMPLVWAHAEYLKLRRSIQDNHIFDQPSLPVRRYMERRIGSNRAIWRFDHQRERISANEILRIEVLSPAIIRWTHSGWSEIFEAQTRDSGLGLHFADLEADDLTRGQTIEWTFHWLHADRWENRNFLVTIDEDQQAKKQTLRQRIVDEAVVAMTVSCTNLDIATVQSTAADTMLTKGARSDRKKNDGKHNDGGQHHAWRRGTVRMQFGNS